MNFETFFTLQEDGFEGLSIWVRPTRYLWKLHPHKAMAELEAYIDTLHETLFLYRGAFTKKNLDVLKNLVEVRRVLFQLETCEDYLAYLKKHYETIH